MPVAKKAPRKKATATKAKVANPFDKSTQPVHYAVAKLLLSRGEHSWEELKEASPTGNLSTRTMGAILVGLETAGARFTKRHDAEYGTCYKLDPNADSLAKVDGADATGEYAPRSNGAKAAPAKKAAKKPAKKAPRKGRPARKPAAKRVPAKPAAKKAAKKAAASTPKVKPRPRRK